MHVQPIKPLLFKERSRIRQRCAAPRGSARYGGQGAQGLVGWGERFDTLLIRGHDIKAIEGADKPYPAKDKTLSSEDNPYLL